LVKVPLLAALVGWLALEPNPVLPRSDNLSTLDNGAAQSRGQLLPFESGIGVNWYFVFFFISGLCSVLYELIWLRLAMAQFGVTTAMVSIVLSVFMAGLGLGSWASGKWVGANSNGVSRHFSALRLYALTEFLIGVSGLLVPIELALGRHLLEGQALTSSATYYLASGLWVALALIPGCTLMGATVPVAMRAIGQTIPAETRRSFSYLYMANVGGAVIGTHVPLYLIELFGFHGALKCGVACNWAIAIGAFALSRKLPILDREESQVRRAVPISGSGAASMLTLLFLSGLTCMAMEVVWVRGYTPYFGTVVYAFASILGVYLLGTFIGSTVYRRWSALHTRENPLVWSVLATSALFPLIAASPGIRLDQTLRLVFGVAPFTGLLGFITPMLVDRYSAGAPDKAGVAYAVNVGGCILGPLLAGFGLLPLMSERWALIVLALPWLIVGVAPLLPSAHSRPAARMAFGSLVVLTAWLIVFGKGYEERFPKHNVLRDATATVIATGTGMQRLLLVNGIGITTLTPITKMMAHLPLAFLDHPPQTALVICFGMGTTFRSLHSWGIRVTAVELVPSVPRLFGYYHSDAQSVLDSPLSHVAIDDGRRYLERTREQFDVITIDPPPPLQAAGSSLLYSEQFYRLARQHLRPGGILQQWLPTLPSEDPIDVAAVARSIRESFAYVRAFKDDFGIHFLCSDQPIPERDGQELVARMPAAAVNDLTEWNSPSEDGPSGATDQLDDLLSDEVQIDTLVAASPKTPALTDDRPINEYYILRKWFHARHAYSY
jgi:spermidine synthase